jgi:hypothetical protein
MAVQLAPIDRLKRETSLVPPLERAVSRPAIEAIARALTAILGVATVASMGSSEIAGVAVTGALAFGATLFAWSSPRT